MNTSDDWRRYVRRVELAVLLIMTILAPSITGCDGSGTYQLSISTTSGGSVTSPGEGAFRYGAGTVVQLMATADDGYEFDGWTGDTQDIADPGSGTTTITMDRDYSITANFDPTSTPGPILP